MIRCPRCAKLYNANSCENCGYRPEVINGLPAWAPEIAYGGGGFKEEYFEQLAGLEASNFWFRARNELVVWALKKHFPAMRSFMEIGCGTGFVLSGIAAAYPQARLVGSEAFSEGLKFAAQRLPATQFMQMDGRNIPHENEFDVIGAFDVLEHIQEDEAVIREIHEAVVPGGGIIITVPQHQWLWSIADEEAYHVRRYGADEIRRKLENAGFQIVGSTSFMFLLLPIMLLSRVWGNRKHASGKFGHFDELMISAPLNKALEGVMTLERQLIRLGLRLPFGGSRLVIARRVKND